MSDLPTTMRQWVLARRPKGLAQESDFSLQEAAVPAIGPGEVLLKTQFLGVAPVMLRYMTNDTSFERDLHIGDVMHGRGVGRVVASNNDAWAVGDLVATRLRWREYAVIDDDPYYMPFRLGHPDLSAGWALGALGNNGYTTLVGLREIARVGADDQVLVSGAAGGVGSHCAFVAKALGARRVMGIAGGPEKCRALTEQMGYDMAIDYKNDDVPEALDRLFPDGIDVFFDNVGGPLLDEVLGRIRRRARITICGRISEYLKDPSEYHRPKNFYRLGLMDAKAEGFFIFDYQEHYREYETLLAAWVREGKLTPIEDRLEGLKSMPAALIGLYQGTNCGARVVRVDPTAH